MKDQVAFPFIEPVFGRRRDVPALKEFFGKDQSTLFVGFHLGHGLLRKEAAGQKNRPALLKHILHFTKDRIERAIRHVEDLVVRWERLKFHKFGNSVICFSQAGRLIEGPFFA
jgi:hypothetical protein